MILEVLESPTLPKESQYVINAAGYINSNRNDKDGYTYIGTANFNESTGKSPNDIIMPTEEIGMGSIHLIIQYKPGKKSYFIRDCGQGTGTFVKIETPLILKQGFIISYGDSHMYINSVNNETVEFKFIDGPKADQIL